jgi:protein phosphatase
LVCSDGLTTMLGEDELLDVLVSRPSLRDAGEHLIAAANAAGGKDNITVVLFRVEDLPTEGDRLTDGRTTITTLAAAPEADGPRQAHTDPPDLKDPLDVAVHDEAVHDDDRRATAGQVVIPRRPRRPASESRPSRGARVRRRLRRLRGPVVGLVVVGLLAAGAYLALQSVYFIGTNQRGLVTMFSGLPYELPGKIKLYSSNYVSGVSASTLPGTRRQALLDHSLRSEGDAAQLMRQLELGQLNGG